MLELFGSTTGNSLRVAIAVEESGLPWQPRKVDLQRGEHRGDAYKALNPTGRVPTLIDPDAVGGRLVLTQSNAIMLYVAEKSGRLLPPPGHERARALEWLFFFVTDVIAVNHQAFYLRGRPAPVQEDAAQLLGARALSMYEHVERQLAGRTFLAGDTFTLADIAGYTMTAALREQLGAAYPNVDRWFETVGARPGVVRAQAAFR
jgi:GST-like protein